MSQTSEPPIKVEPDNVATVAADDKTPAAPVALREEIDNMREKKYLALSQFHDGKPWSADRFWKAVDAEHANLVNAAVRIGNALIVLKEMSPHGEFQQGLDARGIEPRTASNYMRLAAQFTGFDQDFIEGMGKTKLYKLLSAPAEALDGLRETGEIFDLKQHEMIRMSTREFQQAISDATDRMKIELDGERSKNQKLGDDVARYKKEAERARKKLAKREDDPQPEWWNRGMKVIGEIDDYARILTEGNPDLSDDEIKKKGGYILGRIESGMVQLRKFLSSAVVDPEAFAKTRKKKLAALQNDPNLDLPKQ